MSGRPKVAPGLKVLEVAALRFVKESIIRAAPERVFEFHELHDALERLTPEWESSRVLQHAPSLRVGARTIIETRLFGIIPARWVAEHTAYDPPHSFEDVQVEGPFHFWRHRHIVEPHAEGATLRDEIEFEPPLSLLGRLATPILITPRLRRLFEYRHRVTREWCEGAARQ
jgi:ligand-binding SRPBCC domain-containing protein